jgi:hypothetical protein
MVGLGMRELAQVGMQGGGQNDESGAPRGVLLALRDERGGGRG